MQRATYGSPTGVGSRLARSRPSTLQFGSPSLQPQHAQQAPASPHSYRALSEEGSPMSSPPRAGSPGSPLPGITLTTSQNVVHGLMAPPPDGMPEFSMEIEPPSSDGSPLHAQNPKVGMFSTAYVPQQQQQQRANPPQPEPRVAPANTFGNSLAAPARTGRSRSVGAWGAGGQPASAMAPPPRRGSYFAPPPGEMHLAAAGGMRRLSHQHPQPSSRKSSAGGASVRSQHSQRSGYHSAVPTVPGLDPYQQQVAQALPEYHFPASESPTYVGSPAASHRSSPPPDEAEHAPLYADGGGYPMGVMVGPDGAGYSVYPQHHHPPHQMVHVHHRSRRARKKHKTSSRYAQYRIGSSARSGRRESLSKDGKEKEKDGEKDKEKEKSDGSGSSESSESRRRRRSRAGSQCQVAVSALLPPVVRAPKDRPAFHRGVTTLYYFGDVLDVKKHGARPVLGRPKKLRALLLTLKRMLLCHPHTAKVRMDVEVRYITGLVVVGKSKLGVLIDGANPALLNTDHLLDFRHYALRAAFINAVRKVYTANCGTVRYIRIYRLGQGSKPKDAIRLGNSEVYNPLDHLHEVTWDSDTESDSSDVPPPIHGSPPVSASASRYSTDAYSRTHGYTTSGGDTGVGGYSSGGVHMPGYTSTAPPSSSAPPSRSASASTAGRSIKSALKKIARRVRSRSPKQGDGPSPLRSALKKRPDGEAHHYASEEEQGMFSPGSYADTGGYDTATTVGTTARTAQGPVHYFGDYEELFEHCRALEGVVSELRGEVLGMKARYEGYAKNEQLRQASEADRTKALENQVLLLQQQLAAAQSENCSLRARASHAVPPSSALLARHAAQSYARHRPTPNPYESIRAKERAFDKELAADAYR